MCICSCAHFLFVCISTIALTLERVTFYMICVFCDQYESSMSTHNIGELSNTSPLEMRLNHLNNNTPTRLFWSLAMIVSYHDNLTKCPSFSTPYMFVSSFIQKSSKAYFPRNFVNEHIHSRFHREVLVCGLFIIEQKTEHKRIAS